MSQPAGFFSELKRRNVLRAAALYVGAVWALAQGIAQLAPIFGFGEWATRWFVAAGLIGFPFWIAFSWFYEFTTEGLKRESELDPADPNAHAHDRRLDKWIIAVLAVAVVLLLANQFVSRRESALPANPAVAEPAQVRQAPSIAVLPLVNVSNDPEQQFFSDGLSESLIDALSKFDGLRVIGRMSSFQFRESKEGAHAIGARLGAVYLLGGSVQRQGETVRVRAEVVRTSDGVTQWSQSYDRPYRDLFALQDDLTGAIAGVLKARLLPQADTVGARPPSGNLDAYAAYLQGKFNASQGNEQALRKAIELMRRAIELDPKYAAAWAELSRFQVSLATYVYGQDEQRRLYAEADASSSKALALAPKLADAHMSRAWWLENARLDWPGALNEYQKAFALAPGNPWARFNAYGMQALMGQLDEPLRQIQLALNDDPLEASWWNWYSSYLMAAGRLDDATDAIKKAIALQPHGNSLWTQMAAVEIRRGDAAAALHAAQQETEPLWRAIALAMALQISKDRPAADAALKTLIDKYSEVAPYQIAQVHALRGEPDATFDWLERAYRDRDSGMESILVDPFVMRYRRDPRLAAFCSKIGMPSPLDSQVKEM